MMRLTELTSFVAKASDAQAFPQIHVQAMSVALLN